MHISNIKRTCNMFQVPPMIWIQYQLVGAYDSQHVTLECHSEAYPKSINYWTRDKGEIVPQSKYKLHHIFVKTYDKR